MISENIFAAREIIDSFLKYSLKLQKASKSFTRMVLFTEISSQTI
jgi:hypothetical protein